MKLVVVLAIALSIILVVIFVVPRFTGNKTNNYPNDLNPNQLRTPEAEQAGFTVPEGFVIELIASENEGIVNPVDLTFDDQGRLWTQTAKMYPLDPIADAQWSDLLRLMDDIDAQKTDSNFIRILNLYKGKTKGDDKILVISDLYNDKLPATVKVWAENLAIPMSILPYKNGAYVAQGSELFFLNDSSSGGKADQRVPLLTGFGFVDTHTLAHMLVRGPGGWIYFSHGALNKGLVTSFTSDAKLNMNYSKIARFSLDAKKLELVSSGLNNIWGFQLRGNGQWYGTEANDLGYSIVPMEPGTGFPGIGADRIRPYQPWMPELHKFRVGGTGISALAFADDISGTFPKEWKDVALLANPITSTINAVKIVRNPDGTVTANHLPDLLTSKDKSFRPVNMEFGPDGSLYVADWYNKIISHNEVSRADPERDKSHGRIWRIRHVSQKQFPIPDFNTVKTEELVNYLKAPSLWMKRSAWHQITDRDAGETTKLATALVALADDASQDEISRIHALWSLEGIRHYDAKLMSVLLAAPEHNLRREAVRSLVSFPIDAKQTAAALKNMIEDTDPMIRSQVLRTLSDRGIADSSTIDILVRASKPELPGNEMGGAYERKFERYLALKALEQYSGELEKYIHTAAASRNQAMNILWAIQALPKEAKEKEFLTFWPAARVSQLDESTFIMVSKMLANKKIYNTVKPLFENSSNASKYLEIAVKNQQQVQSTGLSSLLETSVRVLLKSSAEIDRQLALDAIGRLNINTPQAAIVSLITDKASTATLTLVLRALEVRAKENKQYFVQILKNKNLEFDLRISALQSLARADSSAALQNLQTWITEFSSEQKKSLVNILSGSTKGAGILVQMYDRKLLDIQSFNGPSAERVYNANIKNSIAKTIIGEVRKQADLDSRAFNSKRIRLLSVVEKNDGDAEKGKIIFQSTCLMCHKVGDKGQSIAPALDGSAARENNALLTAILNPDAAVEGGYQVYRVTRNDNSTVEGYMFSKDDRGTTIAFMGGSKVFIEASDIRSQNFIGGRSFMPKGLIDGYTDAQVASLFAYIKTLK